MVLNVTQIDELVFALGDLVPREATVGRGEIQAVDRRIDRRVAAPTVGFDFIN